MNMVPGYGQIQDALLALNCHLALRALKVAKGGQPSERDYAIYEDYRELLDLEAVRSVRSHGLRSKEENRLYHTLLGHALQRGALPYENELSMWTRGAAAIIDGEKIYLRDVHAWCQKKSDITKRLAMVKETRGLAKFLKPFAMAPWEHVVGTLKDELGYGDYVAYCSEKKGLDYAAHASSLDGFLRATADLYFGAMGDWTARSLGIPLSEANRFDAIYLVGLGEFDHLFPQGIPLTDHLAFFENWRLDVARLPGLHLHTQSSPDGGASGVTFTLRIPQDVHVLVNPQGGWIDLETLFHEMGHGLSAVFTSPDLSPTEKDFNTSSTLSEAFAFLMQNICFSPLFLERRLGLKDGAIETIRRYKALKDMAFFRRYAAKFLAEYEMYRKDTLGEGEEYASLLLEHTGFSYKPETQLFDLAPELYSLDYVMAWMAEASLERFLVGSLGEDWMFKPEAGQILREWWKSGNRDEMEEFLSREGIGPLGFEDIRNRWTALIH